MDFAKYMLSLVKERMPKNEMFEMNQEPQQIRIARQVERNKNIIDSQNKALYQDMRLKGKPVTGNSVFWNLMNQYLDKLWEEQRVANNPRQIR